MYNLIVFSWSGYKTPKLGIIIKNFSFEDLTYIKNNYFYIFSKHYDIYSKQ